MLLFFSCAKRTLTLGSSLNASNIKEGDDVYFECSVRASPAPYKITWRHNGRELSHNVAKKVIISNQSLVLQKVTRADTGVYTCTAHNSEGDGVSNSINLNIKCKPWSSSFFLLCNFTTDILLIFQPIKVQLFSWHCKAVLWLVERLEFPSYRMTTVSAFLSTWTLNVISPHLTTAMHSPFCSLC